MATGSKEREIPEMIQPKHTDIVLEKPTASIFIGTNFEHMVRNHNVTTLIFTGIATEMALNRVHGMLPTGAFIRWLYRIVFLL